MAPTALQQSRPFESFSVRGEFQLMIQLGELTLAALTRFETNQTVPLLKEN